MMACDDWDVLVFMVLMFEAELGHKVAAVSAWDTQCIERLGGVYSQNSHAIFSIILHM